MSNPSCCSAVRNTTCVKPCFLAALNINGTISTSPPTLMTKMISTVSRPTFFSTFSWLMSAPHRRGGNRYGQWLFVANGHPDVVGHDQHSEEKQQSSTQAHQIKRVSRLDALDETIGQGAVVIHSAPHQSLHHAGAPHGGDIKNHADRRRPKMHVDELHAVHLGAIEEARNH